MTDDDGFIGLPPGMSPSTVDPDSGTVRRDRPERPRTVEREEIVFFPVAPPAPAHVEPEQVELPTRVEPVETATRVEPVETATRVESVETATRVELVETAQRVEPVETHSTEPFGRDDLDDATRTSLPRRHAAATWRISVGGREVTVEGVLYLGRNPVATAAHPSAPVFAVDDDTKSVSKTHAMLELDAAGLWVHDLDSTNGVWVIPAGQDPIEVIPGSRTAVPAGSTLELGELAIAVDHA